MKLYFNDEEVALLKGSYKLGYTDEESLNKSEAGTVIREMIREGVLKISVSTYADDTWVKKFRDYKAKPLISVSYYDPAELAFTNFDGYIMNFSCDLIKGNTSAAEGAVCETLWTVSFDIMSY
jgi:hypothetical protein